MEINNSKEKEVIVDIEIGEPSHEAPIKIDRISNKWGKKSLNKLVSGVLGFNGSTNDELSKKPDGISGGSVGYIDEKTELLVDKNVPQVEKDYEKERKKGGKVMKAPKPPRPPRGPSLDAADMRLVKEISKIAIKKRERIERLKALKKMKAARLISPSSTPSSLSPSSGGTVSALVVTVLFFIVLIFQGFGSSTSSNLRLMGAPQPAPETTGLTPVQFYKTVMSDDGAAPSFVPPKFAG